MLGIVFCLRFSYSFYAWWIYYIFHIKSGYQLAGHKPQNHNKKCFYSHRIFSFSVFHYKKKKKIKWVRLGILICFLHYCLLSWIFYFSEIKRFNLYHHPWVQWTQITLLYYHYLNNKISFFSPTNHFSFITYGYKSWKNNIWFFMNFICNPNFLGSQIPSWV